MKDNEFFVCLAVPITVFVVTLTAICGFIFSIALSADISSVPVMGIVFLSFMLIVVPILLSIFMAWIYLPKIRIDENGIDKIRWGRKINGYMWNEVVKIQYSNGYIVFSTIDKIMEKSTFWIGWLGRKDVIYFFHNKKGMRLIQRYCPNKELLAGLDYLL